MRGNEAMERERRLDPGDLDLVEGAPEPGDRGVPIGVDHEQLRDERIVFRRDPIAGLDGGVDPDAGASRHPPTTDPSGRRREVTTRVLGREANLDGMPDRLCGRHGSGHHARGQRPARSDEELLSDEIDVGSQLRHTVLDLQPRVDLEEPELAVLVEQELRGRGVVEAGGSAQPDRHRVQLTAFLVGQARGRRLLDELLVPALDGAVTLPDRDDRAVGIAHQLDLDVAGRQDLALEVDRAIAKGRQGLDGARGQRSRQFQCRRDPTHPPSPTARRRLDEQWVSDPVGRGRERIDPVCAVDGRRLEGSGDDGHTGLAGKPSRRELVAKHRDSLS